MLRPSRIVALDIGNSTVRLAEFAWHASGLVELLDYAFTSLEFDSRDESARNAIIASSVKDLLSRKGISTRRAIVALTGQSVFLRMVTLPPVGQDKLRQIVQYEAAQNVPFPIDEVVWDYQIVQDAGDGCKALLAAIKSEAVENLAHAVEMAGLSPEVFDVSPISIYNAVQHNYKNLSEPVLVVDIGARSTNLVFIDGKQTFMRSLPLAGDAITHQIAQELDLTFPQAERLKIQYAQIMPNEFPETTVQTEKSVVLKCVRETVGRLCREISRSITFYASQQGGTSPSRLLLTGGTSCLSGLVKMLEESLQTPVEFLDPFKEIRIGSKIDQAFSVENIHQFGTLVGLALRGFPDRCPMQINLMPERLLQLRALRRRKPLFLACVVGLALMAAVWIAGLAMLNGLAKKEVEAVTVRINDLSEVERKLHGVEIQLEQLEKDRLAYQEIINRRTVWLKTLLAIQQKLPEGMFLVSVSPLYAKGEGETQPTAINGLRLSGVSYLDREPEGEDAVKLFWEAVRSLPEFCDKTKIVKRPIANAFAREFVIDAVLDDPVEL